MAEIVLRVRLVGGQLIDVSLEDPAIEEPEALIQHAVSVLSTPRPYSTSSRSPCLHRNTPELWAGLEVAPRGAIL